MTGDLTTLTMVKFGAIVRRMDEISISKFKATCLAVLEKVRTTGEPIRVTKFGKPVAEIQPPAMGAPVEPRPERPMGFLEDAFEITGDIIGTSDLWPPDTTLENWDRLMARADRDAGPVINNNTKSRRVPRKPKP